MAAPPSTLHLLLFLTALLAFSHLGSATDHIVGGHFGWNPNVSYTEWLNNHTFYVGDLISFRYAKNTYNVFEVNQTGYDNCTLDGAAGNWTSGKDFVPLPEAKRYYFVCGNSYYCQNGMRISVLVHPLPSNGSSVEPATGGRGGRGGDSAAASRFSGSGGSLLAAILVGLGLVVVVAV